jgi:hypothetical protein
MSTISRADVRVKVATTEEMTVKIDGRGKRKGNANDGNATTAVTETLNGRRSGNVRNVTGARGEKRREREVAAAVVSEEDGES